MQNESETVKRLEREVAVLTERCVMRTEGKLCKFCDVRCKHRLEAYIGKGQKI